MADGVEMPGYALILNAKFGFSNAHGVEADTMELIGESLVFSVGERVVYQVPRRMVRDVEVFATRAEALERLREAQSQPQGKGVLGSEVVARRGGKVRQVGHMVEQVCVITEDIRSTKK